MPDTDQLQQEIDTLSQSLAALTAALAQLQADKIRDREKIFLLSQTSTPVGSVTAFAGAWPPRKTDGTNWGEQELGWMLCDGRPLKSADFRELFAVLNTLAGDGTFDPLTKHAAPAGQFDFNLPDYRGAFLRGTDRGRTLDPDAGGRVAAYPGGAANDNAGSFQPDMLQSHKHDDAGHDHPTNATRPVGEVASDNSSQRAGQPNPPGASVGVGHARLGNPTDSATGAGAPRHGKETRPVNVSVNWIIKFKAGIPALA